MGTIGRSCGRIPVRVMYAITALAFVLLDYYVCPVSGFLSFRFVSFWSR